VLGSGRSAFVRRLAVGSWARGIACGRLDSGGLARLDRRLDWIAECAALGNFGVLRTVFICFVHAMRYVHAMCMLCACCVHAVCMLFACYGHAICMLCACYVHAMHISELPEAVAAPVQAAAKGHAAGHCLC
jgi:hypothetical protein